MVVTDPVRIQSWAPQLWLCCGNTYHEKERSWMPWPTESRHPRHTPDAVTTVRLSTNVRTRTSNSMGRSCQWVLLLYLAEVSPASCFAPPRIFEYRFHFRFRSGGRDSISSSSGPQKNCDRRDESWAGRSTFSTNCKLVRCRSSQFLRSEP